MNVEQPSRNDRLSRISTLWTLIAQAHAGSDDEAIAAQHLLMQRYCGAVYRYLFGALRDEEAATELFQEFALRFLRGDFHRADPKRGRFRDYVKTALIHLVTDYQRAQRARAAPLRADVPAAALAQDDSAERFLDSWREELVDRTWAALAQVNATYHAVLLFHVQNPDVEAHRIGEELAGQLGKCFTAPHIRVTLHRAREKFAALLLDEVSHSLQTPTRDQLIQELRDLNLLNVCSPALETRGP
jgi:RNA polymerase sigma-70 factor (ECF subfamily)